MRYLIEFIKDLKHCWSVIRIVFGTIGNQIVHELPLPLDLQLHVTILDRVCRELTSDNFAQQYSITVDVYLGCLWWGENIRVNDGERFRGSVHNCSLSKGGCKSSYIC